MDEQPRGITVNLESAKAVFDWALKIVPIGLLVLQWYIAQDKTVDRSKTDDAKITALETRINELQRELNETRSDAGALRQHVEDQEKYYLLITKHSN